MEDRVDGCQPVGRVPTTTLDVSHGGFLGPVQGLWNTRQARSVTRSQVRKPWPHADFYLTYIINSVSLRALSSVFISYAFCSIALLRGEVRKACILFSSPAAILDDDAYAHPMACLYGGQHQRCKPYVVGPYISYNLTSFVIA